HGSAGTIVRRFSTKVGIYPHGSAEFVICMAVAMLAAWASWSVFESPILKLRTASRRALSGYDQKVSRTDLYLKIELDLDPKEKPERVATEICRTIRRIYGVRKAEVSSMV